MIRNLRNASLPRSRAIIGESRERCNPPREPAGWVRDTGVAHAQRQYRIDIAWIHLQ
jgi:hypothetical protein